MRRVFSIIAAVVLATACKDEPPPPKPAPKVVEQPAEPEEPQHPLMQIRQAYGLPLPPDVTEVRQGPNFIEVGTKLRISELEKFFKSRLVDYEFISAGPTDLRIVGLRSTMPRIYVFQRAPRIPVAVRYVQQTGALEREQRARAELEEPKPGQQVKATLGNGKPLAPGAVYGEPYTPQPGDPLFKEKYRSNFGKPFGTWVLN